MNKDVKADKPEGFCDNCNGLLCENCGKCCSCGRCMCDKCHPKEEDNEPEIKEVVNYS